MKIAELIESYDSIIKQAFIGNPQVAQAMQGDPSQGGAPQDPSQGQPQPQDPSQGGGGQPMDPNQAAVEQAYAQQLQQQGGDPSQGGQPGQPSPEDQAAGKVQEGGHQRAENELDNTQVTLSVRELLDLTGGGKATQSLLKVKQMATAHNQKMEQDKAKAEQDAQAAAAQQQQAGAMGQGGIYGQPMNADPSSSGGAAPQPAAQPAPQQ